jgi:hypothetical protein
MHFEMINTVIKDHVFVIKLRKNRNLHFKKPLLACLKGHYVMNIPVDHFYFRVVYLALGYHYQFSGPILFVRYCFSSDYDLPDQSLVYVTYLQSCPS